MKNEMGRPIGTTKLNKELIKEIVQHLSSGATIKDTCALCDISLQSFQNWRVRGKKEKSGIYRGFYRAIKPIFLKKEEARWERYNQILMRAEARVLERLDRLRSKGYTAQHTVNTGSHDAPAT